MIMNSNAIRSTVGPYWNEIKNWSREDRDNLYELLEVSFEEDDRNVDDGMTSFVDSLDKESLRAAADFAYNQSKKGNCVPHSQVFDMIKEEMGWK